MRLRSALLCACLAACFATVQAAPTVPLSAFVHEDEYSQSAPVAGRQAHRHHGAHPQRRPLRAGGDDVLAAGA